MQQIIDTPDEKTANLEYATFWARFGAIFIDGLILGVIQGIIFFSLGNGDIQHPGAFARLVAIVLQLLYFTLMESSERQATIGKIAVGIKVGDENGDRISYGKALGRYLGKLLSTLILLIGYLMVLWDDKKQALHDKLANTYVYNAR